MMVLLLSLFESHSESMVGCSAGFVKAAQQVGRRVNVAGGSIWAHSKKMKKNVDKYILYRYCTRQELYSTSFYS